MTHLTKRGYLVLGVAIGLLVAAIVWVSGHVWYVPGEGYCIGTMLECYGESFTR
jgi:hypothetical protein